MEKFPLYCFSYIILPVWEHIKNKKLWKSKKIAAQNSASSAEQAI